MLQDVPLRRNPRFRLAAGRPGAVDCGLGGLGRRVHPARPRATHSPAKAGLVGFARLVPYALFALPAGVALDRWNRKRLMILSDVVRVLAVGSLGVVAVSGHLSFVQVPIVAFAEGTMFVLFNIAEIGAVRSVVPGLIVAARRQGLHSAAIGALIGGWGALSLIESVAAPRFLKLLSMRTVLVGSMWSSLGIAAFVARPNVFVLVAGAAPFVFFNPTVNAMIIGYRVAIVPDRLQGRSTASRARSPSSACPSDLSSRACCWVPSLRARPSRSCSRASSSSRCSRRRAARSERRRASTR